MTEPREPKGEIKLVENAETGGQLFNLAMDLEEANWLSNQDKLRLRTFINDALDLIETSRKPPCKWWQFKCKNERRSP